MDKHQAVPKTLRLRVESYGLWYRLSGILPRHPESHAPLVASRETHPKMSNSKIPHRAIKVLGLPVPFPTSA
jgi:hypothetical protein